MTALNGLLDGATAEALRGLYGVDSSEEAQAVSEDGNSWSDYEDSTEDESYCDRCGTELDGASAPEPTASKEILCGDCDRRTSTHAVGRFLSTEDLELD